MRKLFDHIYNTIKDINFDENELCKQYWFKLERLKANFTDEGALYMLQENIEWLINTKVIDSDVILSLGDEKKMNEAGIYFTGTVVEKDIQLILFKNAKAVVSGHSRVRCFDNSICEAYDSSFITAFHNSQVACKNSKVVAFNSASVQSKGLCLIEDYTEGRAVIKATKRDLVY
jgi:hypothetical protein